MLIKIITHPYYTIEPSKMGYLLMSPYYILPFMQFQLSI